MGQGILEGVDVLEEVSKLKWGLDGEIVVPASYQLGRTLIEHDLVDELRLVVFPVVLGVGERLFGETSDRKRMRLLDRRTIGDGLVILTHEFVRRAQRIEDGGARAVAVSEELLWTIRTTLVHRRRARLLRRRGE